MSIYWYCALWCFLIGPVTLQMWMDIDKSVTFRAVIIAWIVAFVPILNVVLTMVFIGHWFLMLVATLVCSDWGDIEVKTRWPFNRKRKNNE